MTITLTDPLGRLIIAPGPGDGPGDILARLATAELVAFDVETTGVGWHDTLRTVQLGTVEEALILRADLSEHMDPLREWFATTHMPLTAHNAGFDIRFLVHAGLASHRSLWDRLIDTRMLDQLLRPGDGWTEPDHGLKPATKIWCGDTATAADAKEQLVAWWKTLGIKNDADGWRDCPLDGEPYLLYGAADVFDTATLATTLTPLVDGLLGEHVRRREHRAAGLVHGITMRGMVVDVDAAKRDAELAEAEVAAMREGLISRYGIANPGSPVQVIRWFGDRGVQIDSSREEVLTGLALDGEAEQFRTDLLAWKERDKSTGSFLRKLANTQVDADGVARIHPQFDVLGARTGRMTSSNHNMQQFPPDMRGYVKAESGQVLVDADFSAVEIRVAAAFAKDARLTEAFCEGGDPYILTSEAAWGPAPDLETRKARRQAAKPILLGHVFGRSPNTLAKQLDIPAESAKAILRSLDDTMPGVPRYIAGARARTATGTTTVAYASGRVGQVHPANYHTAAVNTEIQGSARELLIDALIALDDAGLGEHLWLPIHDEWVLQVPAERAEEACAALERAMTMSAGAVPIVAEAGVMGTSWGKM